MRWSALLFCLGFLATSADSATFLKITGIEGESRDSSHKGEIEILSFQLTGNSLTFTKKIDLASPMLFLRTADGRHISEAVLTSGPATAERTHTLEDILITGFNQRIGSSSSEEVTLMFKRLKIVSPPATNGDKNSASAPDSRGATSTSANPGQSLSILMKAEPIVGSAMVTRSLAWAAARNTAGSKVQLQPFDVRKALDAGSDRLMQYSMTGQLLPAVRLTLQRQGADFVIYTLSDAQVSDYSRTSSGEAFKLQFAKIEIELKSPTPTGKAAPKAGWDLKANKKV
jgi:type VI secretion system secreted protein Hcp